jgi:formyl-CoA transferase
VFDEPQVKARGVKIELDHPVAGKLPLVASPMRFSGTPLEHKLAPPVLGQHTDEVLRGVLALSEEEIARLRSGGII